MIEQSESLVPSLRQFLPLLIVLAFAALALPGARALLRLRERRRGVAFPFGSQLVMLAITAVAIVGAVAMLLAFVAGVLFRAPTRAYADRRARPGPGARPRRGVVATSLSYF